MWPSFTFSCRLSLCEKALSEYLDTKRLAFPRFYFISSADLLDILSSGTDPHQVHLHTDHHINTYNHMCMCLKSFSMKYTVRMAKLQRCHYLSFAPTRWQCWLRFLKLPWRHTASFPYVTLGYNCTEIAAVLLWSRTFFPSGSEASVKVVWQYGEAEVWNGRRRKAHQDGARYVQ